MVLGVLALHDNDGLLAFHLVSLDALPLQSVLLVYLLALEAMQLVQLIQFQGALLALLLVHPFLLLLYYSLPLFFQPIEVLQLIQQDQLLYFELTTAVLALSFLPHSHPHELSNPLVCAHLVGQVAY